MLSVSPQCPRPDQDNRLEQRGKLVAGWNAEEPDTVILSIFTQHRHSGYLINAQRLGECLIVDKIADLQRDEIGQFSDFF